MATEPTSIEFDEQNLKSAITCALLMSSIDGYVHEKEWALIHRFVKAHWKESYQDFKKFAAEVEQQIAPYLIESIAFKGVLSELVDNLTKDMNKAQKIVLLKLVEDVMVADGLLKSEESELFETFEEKLRIT
jgi:uncharacterized tellurite resistance protein B-like protein